MTDKPVTPEEWQEIFQQDARSEPTHISDRDRALLIPERADFDERLIAMSGLLRRNKSANERLETGRKEIIDFIKGSTGLAQERAIDESGENFYAMVYRSAAHSMAALGMLAPMYESMFYQVFRGIRRRYFGVAALPSGHRRSQMTIADGFWDCHKYMNGEFIKDCLEMVDKLLDAFGAYSKARETVYPPAALN